MRVDVVDERPYAPAGRPERVEFIRANWLQWRRPDSTKYAAIVADDALCNVSYWQTHLFFDSLADALLPGGLFVMRATAVFSPGLVNPTWDEALIEFRQFDPVDRAHRPGLSLEMLTPGVVYEVAWPTLHGEPFYDERSHSFSFGDWNDRVRREVGITVNLKNRLLFRKLLRLTSMPYLELRECWRPGFRVLQAEMPAYSRWESEPALGICPSANEITRRFREYYRIVVLQRCL